jgi:hypothetical protein
MRKLKGYIPTTFLMAIIAFGAVTTPASGGIIVADLTEECPAPEVTFKSIIDKAVSFAKTGIIVADFAPCGIIVGDFAEGIIVGD